MEQVEKLFKSSTEEMEKLLTSKSVVGEPIVVNNHTIVPLLSLGFGFGFGAGGGGGKGKTGDNHDGEGSGGGTQRLHLFSFRHIPGFGNGRPVGSPSR